MRVSAAVIHHVLLWHTYASDLSQIWRPFHVAINVSIQKCVWLCMCAGIESEWRKTQCIPREVCVDVGREFGAPTNIFYKPPCVSVYRCGGCCHSEDKQCRNISTGYLSKTVSMLFIDTHKYINIFCRCDTEQFTTVKQYTCGCCWVTSACVSYCWLSPVTIMSSSPGDCDCGWGSQPRWLHLV